MQLLPISIDWCYHCSSEQVYFTSSHRLFFFTINRDAIAVHKRHGVRTFILLCILRLTLHFTEKCELKTSENRRSDILSLTDNLKSAGTVAELARQSVTVDQLCVEVRIRRNNAATNARQNTVHG